MKKLFTLIILLGTMSSYFSQLATADFESGLPAAWTMSPAASWSLKPSFGTASSTCLYTEEMSTNSTVVSYISPPLNLAAYFTATISFKVAATKTNFLIPNLALYVDPGVGKQLICRWGSGFTQPTNYTLTDVADYQYPLDQENVEWQSAYFFHQVFNLPSVYYRFEAEFVNGGYVLLDDIEIKGTAKTIAGINDYVEGREYRIYPIPATDEKITIECDASAQVSIYNFVGQKLDNATCLVACPKGYELQGLPKGMYYVRFQTKTGPVERTVVIN